MEFQAFFSSVSEQVQQKNVEIEDTTDAQGSSKFSLIHFKLRYKFTQNQVKNPSKF